MGIEIERKFLVIGDSWRTLVTRQVPMRQGYMTDTASRSSIRVRLQGAEARLNIKAAVVGRARAEYDYPVPVPDAHEILDTLCVGLVDKIRYYIEPNGPDTAHGAGLIWEIDEFAGANAGLVVAEIELSDVEQNFERPSWLGAEVTDDQRYYNHALALNPYQNWPERSAT